jgi:hypothetical protein
VTGKSTMNLPAVPPGQGGVAKRNSRKPTRLRSKELRRVHLAIHPYSKLQGILAKANKVDEDCSRRWLVW